MGRVRRRASDLAGDEGGGGCGRFRSDLAGGMGWARERARRGDGGGGHQRAVWEQQGVYWFHLFLAPLT